MSVPASFMQSILNGANTIANTVAPINSTLNNLYSAFGGGTSSGILPTLAAFYNRNQQREALGDAFNAVQNYSNQSLNTLRNVYDQGVNATRPYQQAGETALRDYQGLMRDPSSITSNPAYQFRLNQGMEALNRNLAAKRMLGSGNLLTAITDYGQGAATQELDSVLNRHLPLITAGQNAVGQQADLGRNYAYGVTGINQGLADAAAGLELGRAANNQNLLTDILGMGGGGGFSGGLPLGQLAQGGAVSHGANVLRDLFGGGNAAVAAPGLANGINAIGGMPSGLASIGAGLGAGAVGAGALTGSALLGQGSAAGGAFSSMLGNTAIGQAAGLSGAAPVAMNAGHVPGLGAAFDGALAGGSGASSGAAGIAGIAPYAAAAVAMPAVLGAIAGGTRSGDWPGVVEAARRDPAGTIQRHSANYLSPGVTHRGAADLTQLITLSNMGIFDINQIPQAVFDSKSIENAFDMNSGQFDTRDEYINNIRQQLSTRDMSPADVAMRIFERTTNPTTRANIMRAMAYL